MKKTNLVLALVLIALSSLAYWYEFRKKGELERAAEAKTKLLPIDQSVELDSVKIVSKAQAIDTEIACKAHCKTSDANGEWEIKAPIVFKADEGNVGTFITSLAGASIVETVKLEGDVETKLKNFGLGKEKRDEHKIIVKTKGESWPYNVFIGDNSAVGENMYVYVQGPGQPSDVIRIIPGYLRGNIDRNLSFWRAKKIFDFAASEVEGFALTGPSSKVELARENGNWVLLPAKAEADNEAVETYITGLVFLNAQDFASDDPAKDRQKLGMPSSPRYHLNVKLAKKPEIKMDVYDFLKDKQPKLYAIVDGKNYIVELDHGSLEKFTKKPDAFRLRNLLSPTELQMAEKVKVSIGVAKDALEFERVSGDLTGKTWKVSSGKIDDFESGSFENAIGRVGAARIASFEGKKPVPGSARHLSTWSFLDKAGRPLRSFSVYGDTAKSEYFAKLSTGELAKLERGSGSAVPGGVADFKKGAPQPSAPPEMPRDHHGHHH